MTQKPEMPHRTISAEPDGATKTMTVSIMQLHDNDARRSNDDNDNNATQSDEC